MMTQLGQVSYYPSYSLARTGAEPTGTVEPLASTDSTALATAPTGTDSFTSASTLAPTASTEEPKKQGPNYLAWGALGAAVLTGGLLLGHHNLGWFKEAVEAGAKGADNLANGAEAAAKGAGDAIDNVAGNTPVAKAQEAVAHTLDGINFGTSSAKEIGAALRQSQAAKNLAAEERSLALQAEGLMTHHNINHTWNPTAGQPAVSSGVTIADKVFPSNKGEYEALVELAKTDPVAKVRLESGRWETTSFTTTKKTGETILKTTFVPAEGIYNPTESAIVGILRSADHSQKGSVNSAVTRANELAKQYGGNVTQSTNGFTIRTNTGDDIFIPSKAHITAGSYKQGSIIDEHGQALTQAEIDEYFRLKGSKKDEEVEAFKRFGQAQVLVPGRGASPQPILQITTGTQVADHSIGF